MRRRLVGMAATLGAFVFLVLTSSDVATLLGVVIHLPPNWVLSALFVLGTFLLMRWLWRRLLGTRLAPLIRAADQAMRGGFVWTVLPAVSSVLLILLPCLGFNARLCWLFS